MSYGGLILKGGREKRKVRNGKEERQKIKGKLKL
jgi:hypothetical protein